MPDIFFIMHLIHANQQPGEGYIGLGPTGRIAHAEPGIKTLPVLPRPLRLRHLPCRIVASLLRVFFYSEQG
jgi:hypothetical protein